MPHITSYFYSNGLSNVTVVKGLQRDVGEHDSATAFVHMSRHYAVSCTPSVPATDPTENENVPRARRETKPFKLTAEVRSPEWSEKCVLGDADG